MSWTISFVEAFKKGRKFIPDNITPQRILERATFESSNRVIWFDDELIYLGGFIDSDRTRKYLGNKYDLIVETLKKELVKRML